MNFVRRIIDRKSRRGTRYKYLILPNKLSIQFNDEEAAKRVVIALTHRKRRYECKFRETERVPSTHKHIVEWRQSNTDTIHFNVTFFKQRNTDHFDDKEWTVVLESLDEKDRASLLASTKLNLQNLAGRSLEMTLRLRPSCATVHDCTLTMTFISSMLRGFACFAAADDDCMSAAVIRIPTVDLCDTANNMSAKTPVPEEAQPKEKEEEKRDVKERHDSEYEQILSKKGRYSPTFNQITGDVFVDDEHMDMSMAENDGGMIDLVEYDAIVGDEMLHGHHMHNLHHHRMMMDEAEEYALLVGGTVDVDEIKHRADVKLDAGDLTISVQDEDEAIINVDDDIGRVRKITSRFEEELQNPASKIQADLDEIADRIAEVERLDAYIVGLKMANTEAGSVEEQKFIEQHLRYLTEKEALVRQQDYLNVLTDLKETTEKIKELQRLINQTSTDELISELKTLIDKKDELSHVLINKETEEEEEKERSKLLIQQSSMRSHVEPQPFLRGTVEPLSASKRILTWFNASVASNFSH